MAGGPLLIVAAIAMIEILSHTVYRIPNPPAVILLIVVFSAFHGGFLSGFVSAALAWFYFAVFFSVPGQPFHYEQGNFARVAVWGIAMPAMVVLVGALKRHAERAVMLAAANAKLDESRRYAQDIVANLPVGLAVMNGALEIANCNRAFREMIGLRDGDDVARRAILEFLPLPDLRDQARRVLESGASAQGIEAMLGERHLRLSLAGVRRGAEEEILLVAEDVSGQVRRQRELRTSRAILDRAQAVAHIGSWSFDFENEAPDWSTETYRILGIPPGKPLTYETFLACVPPDEREYVDRAWQAAAKGVPYDIDHRIVIGDEVRWVNERMELEFGADGKPARGVGTLQDITERKRAEARMEHLAFYDPLTGLANRMLCLDRLQQSLSAAHRHGRKLAVMAMDLDLFKNVNDSLGTVKGDWLLREAASRFSGCVREADTVARLGGDEFAAIMSDVTEEAAGALVRKFLGVLREPFVLGEHTVHISCSIGIALYPSDGDDAQTLLRNAEAAMRRAKEQGRDTAMFYTGEMNAKALERLALAEDLHRALASNEFVLHYQPRVDLRSGKVTGIEALVRWQHPGKGLIPPDRFIPLAEETGLILPLGEWVLREACAQAAAWNRAGCSVSVAVNLSARQFRQTDLTDKVDGILREAGLDPGSLELEITESMVMGHAEKTISTLERLSQLGVRLAIDDFGTGYSSLNYLKRFPVHVLKVDKSFIAGIPDDPDDITIVTAIISMAHDLGLRVVAEGVEIPEQLAFLRRQGCDEMQGYYFSKPLPAPEAEFLLREGSRFAEAPDGPESKASAVSGER